MRDYIWSLQKKITKGGEEEEEEPGGGRGFTHKTLNSTPSNSRDIREGGGQELKLNYSSPLYTTTVIMLIFLNVVVSSPCISQQYFTKKLFFFSL